MKSKSGPINFVKSYDIILINYLLYKIFCGVCFLVCALEVRNQGTLYSKVLFVPQKLPGVKRIITSKDIPAGGKNIVSGSDEVS